MPQPSTVGGALMGYPTTVDTGQAQPWLLQEGDQMAGSGVLTAQRAYFIGIYVPVAVTFTALRVSCISGGAGNYDVGIYDTNGNALYRKGSGATSTALLTTTLGTALALSPGTYYLGFWCDNATDTWTNRGGATGMDVLKNINSLSSGLPSTMSGATSGTGTRPSIVGLISGGYS